MRRRAAGLAITVMVACAAAPPTAVATPVSGPHETVDNRLTTTQPNAPSGFSFDGTYHAAGAPSAPPPYMRKMIFYNPDGARYDTTVPERCSASDVDLETRGAAACPAGSRLGGGMTTAAFLGRLPTTVSVDVFNAADAQIMLVHSPEVMTVARGRILPDGSVQYASPTCWPYAQQLGCPVDDVLQLKSSVVVPPYTKVVNGALRSYITTPPTCPPSGHWSGPVRLWWADGSVDTVVVDEPCTSPPVMPAPPRSRHRRRAHRRHHHRRR